MKRETRELAEDTAKTLAHVSRICQRAGLVNASEALASLAAMWLDQLVRDRPVGRPSLAWQEARAQEQRA